MTNIIHTKSAYRTVGTLEVLNEPSKGHPSMISEFYPKAYAAIRAAEAAISVSSINQLHVQFMSKTWGSGDPSANLGTGVDSVWFDNHRYLKYDSNIAHNQASYLKTSCHDDLSASGETDLVIGEWSLSPADQESAAFQIKDKSNNEFYQKWFKAQAMAYEKQAGWIFWSWKAELGDWRWSFRDAVNAGIIPQSLDMVYSGGACEGI
jgi:aryl-phospho-beta-D-glucosidase BglC (GH1 family)